MPVSSLSIIKLIIQIRFPKNNILLLFFNVGIWGFLVIQLIKIVSFELGPYYCRL